MPQNKKKREAHTKDDNETRRRACKISPWYNRPLQKTIHNITITDLDNEYCMWVVLMSSETDIITWLQRNQLLQDKMFCEQCKVPMRLQKRDTAIDGYTWRCANHEKSVRYNSIFFNSRFLLPDLLRFCAGYAVKDSLLRICQNTGMCYTGGGADWSDNMRDLFISYYHDVIANTKFTGIVEIDESLFGRRVKHNKGKAVGRRVWVVGLVEQQTNRIIVVPVLNRNKSTLRRIIVDNVIRGGTIYTDCWKGYIGMDKSGYRHFVVNHKYRFRQCYVHPQTQETRFIHTNSIEGAWKHMKDHFRKINGTSPSNFEAHLCEIMWRSWEKGNSVSNLFHLIQQVYPLHERPRLYKRAGVFPGWADPDITDSQDTAFAIYRYSDTEESPLYEGEILAEETEDEEDEEEDERGTHTCTCEEVIAIPSSLPEVDHTEVQDDSSDNPNASADEAAHASQDRSSLGSAERHHVDDLQPSEATVEVDDTVQHEGKSTNFNESQNLVESAVKTEVNETGNDAVSVDVSDNGHLQCQDTISKLDQLAVEIASQKSQQCRETCNVPTLTETDESSAVCTVSLSDSGVAMADPQTPPSPGHISNAQIAHDDISGHRFCTEDTPVKSNVKVEQPLDMSWRQDDLVDLSQYTSTPIMCQSQDSNDVTFFTAPKVESRLSNVLNLPYTVTSEEMSCSSNDKTVKNEFDESFFNTQDSLLQTQLALYPWSQTFPDNCLSKLSQRSMFEILSPLSSLAMSPGGPPVSSINVSHGHAHHEHGTVKCSDDTAHTVAVNDIAVESKPVQAMDTSTSHVDTTGTRDSIQNQRSKAAVNVLHNTQYTGRTKKLSLTTRSKKSLSQPLPVQSVQQKVKSEPETSSLYTSQSLSQGHGVTSTTFTPMSSMVPSQSSSVSQMSQSFSGTSTAAPEVIMISSSDDDDEEQKTTNVAICRSVSVKVEPLDMTTLDRKMVPMQSTSNVDLSRMSLGMLRVSSMANASSNRGGRNCAHIGKKSCRPCHTHTDNSTAAKNPSEDLFETPNLKTYDAMMKFRNEELRSPGFMDRVVNKRDVYVKMAKKLEADRKRKGKAVPAVNRRGSLKQRNNRSMSKEAQGQPSKRRGKRYSSYGNNSRQESESASRAEDVDTGIRQSTRSQSNVSSTSNSPNKDGRRRQSRGRRVKTKSGHVRGSAQESHIPRENEPFRDGALPWTPMLNSDECGRGRVSTRGRARGRGGSAGRGRGRRKQQSRESDSDPDFH